MGSNKDKKLAAACGGSFSYISVKNKVFSYLIVFVLLATAGIFVLSACRGTKVYTYALSHSLINITFVSAENKYNFPAVETEAPSAGRTVEWAYAGSSIGEPVAVLVSQTQFSVNPIDAKYSNRTASADFTATVFDAGGQVLATLNYKVNVTHTLSTTLDYIYSTQTGHINYVAMGIGKSRVFGLKDIAAPSGGVTPSNYTQVTFVNSFDRFELRWNYTGSVNLNVWAEDIGEVKDAVSVEYDPAKDDREVIVKFNKAGTAKVVAESTVPYRDELKARYEYTYEIVDAVNVRDFEDVKLMERLARYDYITNGVKGVTRKGNVKIEGKNLADYIVAGTENGLLSKHFRTVKTDYMPEVANDAGGSADRYGPGYFMAEFEQWAPAYKYKDIVIRAANKDASQASRRMYTWAESTWFFGSVYGNGYELDASAYTRGGIQNFDTGNYAYEGKYRNIHSMRGIDAGTLQAPLSLGFEGKNWFPGYGWGDIYAFYALSNNSEIDNLTLVGENIPKNPLKPTTLDEYSKIGVLGTSMMAGKDRVFSQGEAHLNGEPIEGLYIEGIRVQNSVIEMGLTLFGASFAPDADNPVAADTCVFRYAGFTAVLGSSYGGGINNEDTENGALVAERNSLARLKRNRHGGRFGNFVVARNNIYHDISVSPLLTMPSQSGTYMEVVGNENLFYTWLRNKDIQFPDMKNPSNEGKAVIMNQTINSHIPSVMNTVFGDGRVNSLLGGDNGAAKYYEKNDYLVNIPGISVVTRDKGTDTDKITNQISFENSSLNGVTRDDFARVSQVVSELVRKVLPEDLDQGFHITMLHSPDSPAVPDGANLIRVENIEDKHIAASIANMTPANPKTPGVVARTFADLSASSVKFMSATRGVVTGSGPLTMAGHKIRYKGADIAHEYNQAEDAFTVYRTALQAAGINKFGLYNFDLVNSAGNQRVSSFSLILQGSNGTEPGVVPGSEGYVASGANQTKFINYPLNIEEDNGVTGVTLLPRTALDYGFDSGSGVLSFEGIQLKHGVNTISVATEKYTLIIRQTVKKLAVGADAYAVAGDMDFTIALWDGVALNGPGNNGLSIDIDGTPLSPGDYTLENRVITVSNQKVQAILGAKYNTPDSHSVIITNANGLNILTKLTVVPDLKNISVVSVTGLVNVAAGHKDYEDVIIELSDYNKQAVLGVAFTGSGVPPAFSDASVIKFDPSLGFKTEQKEDSANYLLTVPAAAIAESGIAAGATEYRVTVFTGVSKDGVLSSTSQTLQIHDADHNEAVGWITGKFEIEIPSGDIRLGFDKSVHFRDVGILGEGMGDVWYDESPFPADSVFIIRNAGGSVVFQSNREELTEENMVYLYFSDGEAKTATKMRDFVSQLFDDLVIEDNLQKSIKDLAEELLPMTYEELLDLIDRTVPGLDLSELFADKLENIIDEELPRTGEYASGICIEGWVLSFLGAGEYTLEIINDYNIGYATLIIK